VWARAGVATSECPRSAITARSLAWLELYAIWRATRVAPEAEMEARDWDALAVLEREWEKASNDERG
jgi:hypothetical protein